MLARSNGDAVYKFYLPEGEKITSINIPTKPYGKKIENIQIKYSQNGGQYQSVASVVDIPSDSCVVIIYEFQFTLCEQDCTPPTGGGGNPEIKTCKGKCPEPCNEDCVPVKKEPKYNKCKEINCNPIVEDCGPYPPENDPTDSEWETIEKIHFFGQTADGEKVLWTGVDHFHDIPDKENTRILYLHYYSNSYSWSKEYKDFNKIHLAQRVRVSAYIQVRKSKLDTVEEINYPKVTGVRLYNEKGYTDLSMVQPSLAIIPVKDNNPNNDIFSDESKITWDYIADDPRNKKIIDVEWAGDIREKYPVGKYTIQARVKNEIQVWSEWVTYKLEVVPEKPVAIIKLNPSTVQENTPVTWGLSQSYDADGDGLINVEWAGDKKSAYSKAGDYVVKARVQDKEGYWSDWTEYAFSVFGNTHKVYRLEAEATGDSQVKGTADSIVKDPNYSGGSAAVLLTNSALYRKTFHFYGSAADIMVIKGLGKAYYKLDESNQKIYLKDGLNSIRNLKEGNHIIEVSGDNASVIIDYVDIYSTSDKVNITNLSTKTVIDDVFSKNETTIFSSKLGQKMHISYQQDKDSQIKVTVLDKNNKIVKDIQNKNQQGGTYRNQFMEWDGTTNSGETALNGNYIISIEATGVTGTKTNETINVTLKNEYPSYRLEAEATKDPQVTGTAKFILEDASYSGGKVVTLVETTIKNSKTFTFKGTGVDIKILNVRNNAARYRLDGGEAIVISEGLNTIRNLEDTTHTLKIYGASYNIDLDYIDIYSNDGAVISNIRSQTEMNGLRSNLYEHSFATRLGQFLHIDYEQDQDGLTTISVLDSNNKSVRTISSKDQKGGTSRNYFTSWDGRDNTGNIVTDGTYTIQFVTTNVNGTVTKYTHRVVLDNSISTDRIEFETREDARLTGAGRGTISNVSYSGGYAAQLYQNSTKVLKFVGTGFDIMVLEGTSGDYFKIDGREKLTFNQGLNVIRNLSEGEHTITFYGKSNSQRLTIDYVDIYK